MSEEQAAVDTGSTEVGALLDHVVCCLDSDLALCGCTVPGEKWVEELADPCVVCMDVEQTTECPLNHQPCRYIS